MATYSSILAWRIPQTEESGGLPSMGLQSQTQLRDFAYVHTYIPILHLRKQPQRGYTTAPHLRAKLD